MTTVRIGFYNNSEISILTEIPGNTSHFYLWSEKKFTDLEADYSFNVVLKDYYEPCNACKEIENIANTIINNTIHQSNEEFILNIFKIINAMSKSSKIKKITCDVFEENGQLFYGMDSWFIKIMFEKDEIKKYNQINDKTLKVMNYILENLEIFKPMFSDCYEKIKYLV